MNQWEVSRAVAHSRRQESQRERECGIHLFIEGHAYRAQHSVGMHKHSSKAWDLGVLLLLLPLKWTTTFYIHSNRMSKKAAKNIPEDTERKCVKQHVEGEISKQNVYGKHTFAFANQTKRWKGVYTRMHVRTHASVRTDVCLPRVHIELEWNLQYSENIGQNKNFCRIVHLFSV